MDRLNNYMKMNKGYFLSIVLFCVVQVNAQTLTHVEPANWWVGMCTRVPRASRRTTISASASYRSPSSACVSVCRPRVRYYRFQVYVEELIDRIACSVPFSWT